MGHDNSTFDQVSERTRGRPRRLLYAGLLALLAWTPLAALHAQEKRLEEIVVTGSNIKRSNFDSTANLNIVDRAELESMGIATVTDVMKFLTSNTGSNFNVNFFNQGETFGEASFNLRGLGPATTLVLVNGRRYVKAPTTDENGVRAVDINTMPLAMVERIEVLKAGASAIYGSDAVAGVVNIVTRDFEGLRVNGHYQLADGGGQDEATFNVAAGVSNERGRMSGFFTYFDRSIMESRDATFTAENLFFSTTANPGSVRLIGPGDGAGGFAPIDTPLGTFLAGPDGGPRVADPDCLNLPDQPPGSHVVSDDGPFDQSRCLQDILDFVPVVLPETRIQAFADAEYAFSDSIRAFAEVSFSANDIQQPFAGQLGTVNFGSPVTVPADHPYNEFGVPLKFVGALFNSFIEGRAATNVKNHDLTRAVGGLEIGLGEVWSGQLSYQWSRSQIVLEDRERFTNAAAVQAALDGRGGFDGQSLLNPFASQYVDPARANDPALKDWLLLTIRDLRTADLKVIDGLVTGSLGNLPGGPLGLAFGAQYRKDELEIDISDEFNQNLSFPGTPGTPDAAGDLDVFAVYGEVALPVTDALELQAALRYEDYGSQIGDTTDPKLAFRWDATQWLSVRGSFGTSFRGPDVVNTSVDVFTNPGGRDPVRLVGGQFVCTRTSPSDPFPDDRRDDIFTAIRGNEALQPEESESIDFGVIFSPLEDLRLSVDYWQIDYTDVITQGDDGFTIVLNDCFDDGVPNDPRITRDAATGRVQLVESGFINASSVETSGVDLAAGYEWRPSDWGVIRSTLHATHIAEFDIQLTEGGEVIDGAGSRNILTPFRSAPEWRVNLALDWLLGNHGVHAVVRHIGTYDDDNALSEASREIDSMTTLDLQYEYSLGKRTTLTVGALNVFDEKVPPVDSDFMGFDATVHDPRGRLLYTRAGVRF